MTLQDAAPQYGRLRAPRRHGATLIEPTAEVVPALVDENRRQAVQDEGDLHGKSRSALAASARRGLIASAVKYTAAYRNVADPAADATQPILLTGHQPQLFHPGVWFKNFVSWRLAQRLGARAVHVLIDNDTAASAAIRVPTGSVAAPSAEYVALDRAAEAIPFEARSVLDVSLFESFGRRVARLLKPLIDAPLVNGMWPFAVSALRRSGNLGRAVAEARHQLEGRWGVVTWEVPLSELCEAEPFRWFAAHLLAELPRFVEVHNAALAEYRRANRIRSQSHPVPRLVQQDQWQEAPFWIWSRTDPRRRRLFVRRCGAELELTDRAQQTFRVDSPAASAEKMIQRLADVSAEGVKIRSRALTTTMYARLFLGDFFLHGIGGAKYDQLTDVIVQRFFGWKPPAFGIVTATLRLPVTRPYVDQQQLRDVEQKLREMRFHPEQFVPQTAESQRIVEEKLRWIASDPPAGRRLERHRRIVWSNQALQVYLHDQRSTLLTQHERLRQLLRHEKLLGSREFSFCLFPESSLRPFLLDF